MPIQQSSYATPRADLGAALYEFDPTEEGFIAASVLPTFAVRTKTGTLSVITRENLEDPDDAHVDGAAFERVSLGAEDMTYACLARGLEGQLTDRQREQYVNDFDAEEATVRNVRRRILIGRERRAAAAVFNTTTWTGAALTTDNHSAPWSTTSTNIFSQVEAAKEKVRQGTGVMPNALIIGAETLSNMLENTGILARFPGAAMVTDGMLAANMAALFGLKRLIVGRQVYNSADEGQAFSGTDIWAKTYAMVAKVAETSDLTEPCIGRILYWDRMAAGEPGVLQYREEQTESDIFRCQLDETEKIIDPYFGHLMQIEA